METFDVAIWEKWGSVFPEQTELVEASSALEALEQVMRIAGIQRASRASVSPAGTVCISRYEGLRLTLPNLEVKTISSPCLQTSESTAARDCTALNYY